MPGCAPGRALYRRRGRGADAGAGAGARGAAERADRFAASVAAAWPRGPEDGAGAAGRVGSVGREDVAGRAGRAGAAGRVGAREPARDSVLGRALGAALGPGGLPRRFGGGGTQA